MQALAGDIYYIQHAQAAVAYLVGIFALSRLQQTFLHHLVQESAGNAQMSWAHAGWG